MSQYINKVIVNGVTKIDLTGDTVAPELLLKGATAHDKSGAPIEGACTFDADTSGANALAAEILLDKTAFVKGVEVKGTMPNNGAVAGKITDLNAYTIPRGYHDGSGTVEIADAEKAKLIAENIREGVTVLGIEGTMSGTEDAVAQSVNVTPGFEEQEILPDASQGYNYLASVKVAPIPMTEVTNEQGGMTLTIGA